MNAIVKMTLASLLLVLVLAACAGKKVGEETASPVQMSNVAAVEEQPAAASPEAPAAGTAATMTSSDQLDLKAVYFEYDSVVLTAAARRTLEENAVWMKANPTKKVTIEGHCDERGSDEYNFALGENRALAVKKYLTDLGVAAERLATISYGEERPTTAGHDEAAWAKNRRSEFN